MEASVTYAPDGLIAPTRAERLRRIFDYGSSHAPRQCGNAVEVGDAPAQVRGDNGKNILLAQFPERLRTQVKMILAHVAQHRRQVAVNNRQGDQWTSVGRDDNRTPGTGTFKCRECNDQGSSAGTLYLHLGQAQKFGQLRFKGQSPAGQEILPRQRESRRWRYFPQRVRHGSVLTRSCSER